MDYGIIACLPVAVLIVGVLITKKMVETIIVTSVFASILMYKQDFFVGFLKLLYETLSDGTFQLIVIILFGFGAMIKLFEKSGALNGFGKVISKFANTKKKTMLATWIMGIIVFLDDYLNVLAVSFSMRSITDKNGVPREHLAYGVNAVGVCSCVLIPVTSWAAFAVATAKPFGVTVADYVHAIPYMFYPIVAVTVCLLVALGVIPKFGALKKAYERVDAGGPILLEENEGASVVSMETEGAEDITPSSPINFFIPIIVLVAFMLIMDNSIEYGIIAGIATQAIMYIPKRKMNVSQFINTVFDGFSGMVGMAVTICFVYMIASASLEMGMADYLVDTLMSILPVSMLPFMIFICVAIVGLTADSWVLTVLVVPIFIPLAQQMGMDVSVAIAAIMSGVSFGSSFCLFADAVFMVAAGTGISNVKQIKIVAPYTVGSAIIAAIAFAILGMFIV